MGLRNAKLNQAQRIACLRILHVSKIIPGKSVFYLILKMKLLKIKSKMAKSTQKNILSIRWQRLILFWHSWGFFLLLSSLRAPFTVGINLMGFSPIKASFFFNISTRVFFFCLKHLIFIVFCSLHMHTVLCMNSLVWLDVMRHFF